MARTRKPVVEVRRSQRRRRTVSAYRDGERVVVLIPDRFSRAEETEWVQRMLARIAARGQRIPDARARRWLSGGHLRSHRPGNGPRLTSPVLITFLKINFSLATVGAG